MSARYNVREAYRGELFMARGLVGVLRVVAEHGDMAEVQRLLAEHASDERDAYVESPDITSPDPLVVSRFDAAIEPAPEEEQILTVGCIAEDGRPVALLLTAEDRAKVAEWLAPSVQLTPSEQQFLTFALELAADQMANRGDEFEEADEQALASLRRLTGEQKPPSDRPTCAAPESPSCSCNGDEYRFCGATLGRTEYPFTCNRRVAHHGPCSGEMDAEAPRE